MSEMPSVAVRFFRLSEPLQPYFTALYLTEINIGHRWISDYLHPEWAAMRFTEGPTPLGGLGTGQMVRQWPFVAGGPTSVTTHFSVTTCKVWGLGLQPAGWSKFIDGEADKLANCTVNGSTHPAFAVFADILPQLLACEDGDDAKAELIDRHLMRYADRPVPREEEINALQDALRNPAIGDVATVQDLLGMSAKSLERFCRRYFGFTPKVLLRRQRFARSLAHFMLDPSLDWIDAIDGQYHDQAQFIREFRNFMGILPGEYAKMPHPVVQPIMRQRMADQGIRLGPLDLPTVGRYR